MTKPNDGGNEDIADCAYQLADAMLAARESQTMSREQDGYKRGVGDALRVAVDELQKYSLIARNRGWVGTADIEKAVTHLRDNIRNGCKSLTLGMK